MSEKKEKVAKPKLEVAAKKNFKNPPRGRRANANKQNDKKKADGEDPAYEELEVLDTDVDPAELELIETMPEGAAPMVRPYKLTSVGKDFTVRK